MCLSDLQNPTAGTAACIRCRACGCPDFFVIYTRRVTEGIRRWQCRHCGKRITTTERTQGS
jgi:transcriptional regulator NrdR family protein